LALTPGTRLGAYEVTAQIGEGGMGQVYRATDTKLKRQVAIKILPPSLAADSDRLARFQREAEVLASLNHPHIAAIYGLEESGDITALVMELVEGEDLSQRIARGAMPLDEALPIAKQIAEALEAAHEQGIIHRDLKPANIKVRADGTVKVLDFGLAKAIDPTAGSSATAMNSPTLSIHATQAGMILGTAAYMSPEQARGTTVDKRADVWAFGVVLWEMLTGRRLFEGATVSDTLAAVLTRDPDWTALPAGAPPAMRRLLRRCLEKDRKRRLADAADARLEIDEALAAPLETTTTSMASLQPRGRVAWMVATGGLLAVAVLSIPTLQHLRETPPPAPPETRLDIVTPATSDPASFALSPDGQQIVFVASGDGAPRLWLRALSTTTAQPLAGTESALHPFWSPDGRSIGFFAEGALKRLDLGGGAPQTLATAVIGRGGTWNADGVIVFAVDPTTPLMRVSATGGRATAVTTLGTQQSHRWPHFLPDRQRFLFSAQGREPDSTGIYLGTLDGSTPTRLTPDLSEGVFLPAGPAEASSEGGWLLWVRAGALMAQHLDVSRAALVGEPVTLADGLTVDVALRSAVSVASTRLVAYRTGTASRRQLTWFDRSGTARGTVGEADASFNNPRVSPDGRRVAVSRRVQGNRDLWLLDGARTSRFTFDPAVDDMPLWSPDGTRIVFRSNRTGPGDLYQKLTSGASAEEQLVSSDQLKAPSTWSADGRFVLFNSIDSQSVGDLWAVPMTGDRTPSVLLKTPFREAWGALSPDGRWVAYHSNESGRPEVYVRSLVPPGAISAGAVGGRWPVSTAGGIMPVWRPDGKELYYLNPAGAMMATPIPVMGASLAPGEPALLFPTRIFGGGVDLEGRQYDVAPDGRFLINTELDGTAVPITLLMNWQPGAKK